MNNSKFSGPDKNSREVPFDLLNFLEVLSDNIIDPLGVNKVISRTRKDDGSLVVKYNLAGYEPEEVSVKVDEALHEVKISAKSETEDQSQKFKTIIALSPYSTSKDVTAKYKNGVLEVVIAHPEKKENDNLVDVPLS